MPTILLVDDDPHVLSTYGKVLRDSGYSVTQAANGVLAIEALRANAFDLVIVDLIMPESDGVEVIDYTHTNLPQIKIVAMTGGGILSAQDYLKMAQHLGATYTLAKPCSREDLLAIVGEALHRQ